MTSTGRSRHLVTRLSFPLASNLGILAVILPGGLDAPERILVGYPPPAGLSPPRATPMAVTARLRFLIGESLIFCRDHAVLWKPGEESPGPADLSPTNPSSASNQS